MKHTRKIGLFALLAGASILPSVLVEDAALDAVPAIKGQSIQGGGRYGSDYTYGTGTRWEPLATSNGLLLSCKLIIDEGDSESPDRIVGVSGFIDLNDLTVNQALPEAPVVQLNLSESPTSGKTLVRWNID